ncbi:AraC family transcriptional regulator ligand-binding domain-containing protein [Bacterioplanes sanyensis]|uniref:AraC family transcriptional regulator ligand-binding domain-containing protein n=1 Tax=Bacterioplanes sanyensis TaxID=1249553 RepID=UPI0012FD761E|nr:AraC family transcriptional regulator ligand-binding domain-containing protein [Bacterioplanes sanyensis]
MQIEHTGTTVAFIAVVDLARQLLQRRLVSAVQLADVDAALPEWVAALQQQGADRHWLYRTLPEEYLLQLWQLADNLGGPCLGLELGAEVNRAAQGVLAYRVERSDTLGAALEVFAQHIALMNPAERWQIDHSDSTVTLLLHCPEVYPRMARERSVVALQAWASDLCGSELQPLAWFFPWQDGQTQCQWLADYSSADWVRSSGYGLCFAREVLSLQLTSADAYLSAVLDREIQALAKPQHSLNARVLSLLASDLSRFSQAQAVAQQLAMSRASLYRQLKREGFQFRQLLDQQRQQQWRQWRHRVDAISMAERLGFADVSGLYKAQKRWQAAEH